MLVVLPVALREVERAREHLLWQRELGGLGKHHLLVLTAQPVPHEVETELYDLGRWAGYDFVYRAHQVVANEQPWPINANALFACAAAWVLRNGEEPWLWCELDMIPLREGWLDEIEAEYRRAGRPFMGTIYEHPRKHFNGGMVYPASVAAHNPSMVQCPPRPFDLTRPELVLAKGHNSPLFWRSLADPATNTPHTFPTQESLSLIPPQAVIAHCCKDGTLIARLQQRRWKQVPALEMDTPTATVAEKPVKPGNRYYHSGNLGDLIYGLYAIYLHGEGQINGKADLLIGPVQQNTSPCGAPINEAQFKAVLPLLRAQPYLGQIRYCPRYPAPGEFDHDLNVFRNHWHNLSLRARHGIDTLCKAHCYTLGVLEKFREDAPWLTVPRHELLVDRVVVQRSPRYHTDEAHPFPWKELGERYADRLLFVGLEAEHKAFEQLVRARVSYWKCRDLLEMAQLIAGAKFCVCNQSFPLSLALGLRQPVVCEEWPPSADCRFDRESYCGHMECDALKTIDAWML